MKILFLLLLCFLLTGCGREEALETTHPATIPQSAETAAAETTAPPDPAKALLSSLSVEERVGQLFLARCDGSRALQDIRDYHLGGFVLFSRDFEGQTPDSIGRKLASYQAAAKVPLLLAVDEEGGTVTRISRYPAFRPSPFPSPREAKNYGGLGWTLVAEDEKARLLNSLGINVNLGPVCDIATDPAAFMYDRSLGLSPEDTGFFVSETVRTMAFNGVGSVLKHFPGYGNNPDTHVGIARDSRSLEELEGWDLKPFAAGIDAGAGAVLVSHVIVEALDDALPASLSSAVHRYLREEMGFDGVILTDDLVMEAITDAYGAGEAAVMAVLAGNDLLCSTDYILQYEAVLDAVLDGRISMDTLDAAVRRVLQWKMDLAGTGR